ncbi:alpha/beta hydrolase [Luedemannella helvata]|uniref:Alpha/beta hydrolase n=2 Tax=Luedemannella helvata TaxID=349315 RepID=A0ABP4WER5_9ACTN
MRPPHILCGMTRVLVVPGYQNSGPGHWQTLWEQENPDYIRVEQDDWEHPTCDAWVSRLDEAVNASEEEVVLVAHSLGAITVVRWAAAHVGPVRAALLVAPADVENLPDYPFESFTPVPLAPLPFEAFVVGSITDPYVSIERARAFAGAWRAVFIDAGDAGHINVDSGHGPWDQGELLLAGLLPGTPGSDDPTVVIA